MVWAEIIEAIRQLLTERDYDSINMGHIAARVGIARNTLYNYAPDKSALVRAVTHRAATPMLDRVAAIGARSADSATDRMLEIIGTVLDACTDQALQLMFRPGSGPLLQEIPKGPDAPFEAVIAEVENVVRDGITRGEFRDVGDVRLAVELLSGMMHAGAVRITRDPATFTATVAAAQRAILASLRKHPDRSDTGHR
ncbi:TetR/AcrR family transcriptional regulator [Solwaraspora sp. WMMB335]|uniref:TetR/AcrR family transcriptional regulator n=1 Tax=Solwaraspora sp. WMMB335 TaxID=3404118 RepID=UPI003B952E86